MINELQQLLAMIQNVPDMVLHVLLGFAVYKIIIFLGTSAGIYGTLRLAINKLYDYKRLKSEQPQKVVYQVREHFIDAKTMDEFLGLISITKRTTGVYIHGTDVQWFRDAVNQKLQGGK